MEIRVGEVGKVISGDDQGSYVKVVDDTANTGGFLILISSTPEMSDGYDNWVEGEDALRRYFKEAGWVVAWKE